MRRLLTMIALGVLAGCPGPEPDAPTVDDGSCGSWRSARIEAAIEASELEEISGVARSHRIADTLWVHGDHGDDPFLRALGTDGSDRGTYSLVGASHVDWEDIALGPCGAGADACSCLYVGDIGDNDRLRERAVVYRVAEPDADDVGAGGVLVGVEELWFRYPDGARDAEALLVEPDGGETFVVTKAADGITEVFAFPEAPPREHPEDAPVELVPVLELDLDELDAGSARVTAGDVSPRGRRVVLRTDDDVLVFRAPAGSTAGPVRAALGEDPLRIAGPKDENGEALAVSVDGATLWLAGESASPALWSIGCATFTPDGFDGPDPLTECDASGR